MTWQDAFLALAGMIGSGVAILHGVLLQRLMVRPLEALAIADRRTSATIRRLLAPVVHFSTYSWLLGGLALIASAIWFGHDARLTTGLLVGSLYLYGVVGNCWATRGRHPGWMLLAAALVLIALGIGTAGG